MKIVKLGLVGVLVLFGGFSAWVMWQIGYSGIWLAGVESMGSLQILLDLSVACSLIGIWIYQDAKSRGVNPYPWLVGTLLGGSLAPLLYLIIRAQKQSNRMINEMDGGMTGV